MDASHHVVSPPKANVPRYTSYPTANHFVPGGGSALTEQFHAAIRDAQTVSVYIHIPYCDRMCWFCGCHTKQTASYEPVRRYIGTLRKEVLLLAATLGKKPDLARLHLGGGSPSLLRLEELVALKHGLADCFNITPETEVSIELDPSDLDTKQLGHLMAFGMTRASIGVQDFDPAVQGAINRPQSFELTRDIVLALRGAGIASINIDMLYGLPYQTPQRVADTVTKVLSLHPERIALFGYAHVPWMKPHQKLIPVAALPGAEQRLSDAIHAAELIVAAGYDAIGIDHFAMPADRLALAAHNGTLRRNFQGYVEDNCNVLIGLGASSISQFPGGFLQNEVASGRYAAAIEAGHFAYDRGIAITIDDRARGWIIEQIMCAFGFSKERLAEQLGGKAEAYWSLAQEVAHGNMKNWIDFTAQRFSVRKDARPFARSIAAAFDSGFSPATSRHSAAV